MQKIDFKNYPDTSTPLSAENLNQMQDNIEEEIDTLSSAKIEITEQDLTKNNGYIRYSDGTQVAWKEAQVTAGGGSFGNIFYSDHSMGNWEKSFTSLSRAISNVDSVLYWTTCDQQSTSSAGRIRCYRATSGTSSILIRVVGYGKWK